MTSPVAKDLAPIVGANIKRQRLAMGMTQREFAAAVNGLDTLAISRWERGVSLPRQDNLQALAQVTGREVAWFYKDREPERKAA